MYRGLNILSLHGSYSQVMRVVKLCEEAASLARLYSHDLFLDLDEAYGKYEYLQGQIWRELRQIAKDGYIEKQETPPMPSVRVQAEQSTQTKIMF